MSPRPKLLWPCVLEAATLCALEAATRMCAGDPARRSQPLPKRDHPDHRAPARHRHRLRPASAHGRGARRRGAAPAHTIPYHTMPAYTIPCHVRCDAREHVRCGMCTCVYGVAFYAANRWAASPSRRVTPQSYSRGPTRSFRRSSAAGRPPSGCVPSLRRQRAGGAVGSS